MKRRPYNACDYRCERCLETDHCAVFQQLRGLAGEEAEDPGAVLAELRESFRETESMIKKKARRLGIDIDSIAGGATSAEISEERKRRGQHPLLLVCERFTQETALFLKGVEAVDLGEDRQYIDDIAWHQSVIPAKMFRALGWRTDAGTIAVDARNSAAVALKSLTICILAFDHLASRHPDLAADCRRLSADAGGIKERIKEVFFPPERNQE